MNEDNVPSVPVTELEELLNNFIGHTGSSGEDFLISHIQEIIDKARGVEQTPVNWAALNAVKIPGRFEPCRNRYDFLSQWVSNESGSVIPKQLLERACQPLAEGEYTILKCAEAVSDNTTIVMMALSGGCYLTCASSDLPEMPSAGDILKSVHLPKPTYTIVRKADNDV